MSSRREKLWTVAVALLLVAACGLFQAGHLVDVTHGGQVNPIFSHTADTSLWLQGGVHYKARLGQHLYLYQVGAKQLGDQWNSYFLLHWALHLVNACLVGLTCALLVLLFRPPGPVTLAAALAGAGVAALFMSGYDNSFNYDLALSSYPLQTFAALATLCACLLYLLRRGWYFWLLALAFHLAGVFTHSFALLFPGVLLAVELVWRRHAGKRLLSWGLVLRYALLLLLAAPVLGEAAGQLDQHPTGLPPPSEWFQSFAAHLNLHLVQLPLGNRDLAQQAVPLDAGWPPWVLFALAAAGLVLAAARRAGMLAAVLLLGVVWHLNSFVPLLAGASFDRVMRSFYGMAGFYTLAGILAAATMVLAGRLEVIRRFLPCVAPLLWLAPVLLMTQSEVRWEKGMGRLLRGDVRPLSTCQFTRCKSLGSGHSGEPGAPLHDGRCQDLADMVLHHAVLPGLDLRGSRLVRARLSGISIPGARLDGVCAGLSHIERSDLSGARMDKIGLGLAMLRELDLTRASLPGARLQGAMLAQVVLRDADMRGADLSVSMISESVLAGANLEGANLDEVELRDSDANGISLPGVVVRNGRLVRTDFRGANLRRIQLMGTHLEQVDLRGADLRDAQIFKPIFRGVDLRGADLRRAQLSRAAIRGLDLRGANLGGATLENMNLGRARLAGANLAGVTLSQVDVGGADLTGCLICLRDREALAGHKGHPLWIPCPDQK